MTTAPQQTAADPPTLLVDAVQGARGDRILFSSLSFTLARGQLLYITGPNGSGKTTLLRILCGLLTPLEGVVRWHGHDIRSSASTHRRECTYIGHRDGLKAELTALENLQFNARMSGCRDTAVIEDTLRLLGLWEYQDLLVGHLSAGQRRRLALGRLDGGADAAPEALSHLFRSSFLSQWTGAARLAPFEAAALLRHACVEAGRAPDAPLATRLLSAASERLELGEMEKAR